MRVTVEVVPADLSRPGSPDPIVETLAQRHIDVDVLVNNAGFGPAVLWPGSASGGSWRWSRSTWRR